MRVQTDVGFLESLSATVSNLFNTTDPLSQSDIDRCSRAVFKDSADISSFFSHWSGFIAWYNTTLAETPAFASRRSIDKSAVVADRFRAFWDNIPEIFGTPSITGVEFSALMCIGLQECSGDLSENPEEIDHPPNHPGLTYAFDVVGGKSSYNVNKGLGQWPAGTLFANQDYVDAHKALPGYHQVSDHGIDPAWNTSVWPTAFPPVIDDAVNGFVMQADFFKFRGRGVIQTTGRLDYIVLVEYILANAVNLNSAPLIGLKTAWEDFPVLVPGTNRNDAIASRSTDAQWSTAFSNGAVLAAAVNLDSVGKGNYLQLSHEAGTLNGGITQKGSLYYMARKINGGNYPNEVVPMMKAMIRGIAAV